MLTKNKMVTCCFFKRSTIKRIVTTNIIPINALSKNVPNTRYSCGSHPRYMRLRRLGYNRYCIRPNTAVSVPENSNPFTTNRLLNAFVFTRSYVTTYRVAYTIHLMRYKPAVAISDGANTMVFRTREIKPHAAKHTIGMVNGGRVYVVCLINRYTTHEINKSETTTS